MNIIDRVRNICLSPATEWNVIEAEGVPGGQLISGYVVPLAGLSALASFIGGTLVGQTLPLLGTYRTPFVAGLGILIFTFVMAIVSVFVLSAIINALAPSFGGEKNPQQAMKVAVYSFTPAWVAGVFQILPALALLVLLGSLYSLYVLYLGLPKLMKAPQDKAIGYTAVVVICAIVLSVVIGGIASTVGAAGMFGASVAGSGPAGQVAFDPDSTLGRLEQLGRQAEQAGREIDSAGRSNDPGAAAAAAATALGSLLGGGARVEPVALEVLQPLVPETFAGLTRTTNNSERAGLAGIMIARAEATYGAGERTATLEVQDTGGVSGLVGLASWMGVEGQRENDSYAERNGRVNGRFTHEKRSKTGDDHEFALVLGERFIVSARGRGMTLDELKAAVSALDLAKIEALK
ncbi:MAG: Yip1 family protein [Vicinamibacterales bacterium]